MGCLLEVVDGNIFQVLALEDPVEHTRGPFSVIRGERSVPSVEQVKLYRDDISLANRLQVMVGVSDGLTIQKLGGLLQGEGKGKAGVAGAGAIGAGDGARTPRARIRFRRR